MNRFELVMFSLGVLASCCTIAGRLLPSAWKLGRAFRIIGADLRMLRELFTEPEFSAFVTSFTKEQFHALVTGGELTLTDEQRTILRTYAKRSEP